MIGCFIYCDKHRFEVEDKVEINGTTYLLVKNPYYNYAISKIVKPGEYVRLSEKRVLESKKDFSDHECWELHSKIEITAEGKIKSVKVGSWIGPYDEESNGLIHIYIIG